MRDQLDKPPLTLVRLEELRAQPVLTTAECAQLLRMHQKRFLNQRPRLHQAGFPQPITGLARRGMKFSGAAVFRYIDGHAGDAAAPAAPQLGTAIAGDDDEQAAEQRAIERRNRAHHVAQQGRSAA